MISFVSVKYICTSIALLMNPPLQSLPASSLSLSQLNSFTRLSLCGGIISGKFVGLWLLRRFINAAPVFKWLTLPLVLGMIVMIRRSYEFENTF